MNMLDMMLKNLGINPETIKEQVSQFQKLLLHFIDQQNYANAMLERLCREHGIDPAEIRRNLKPVVIIDGETVKKNG